MRMLVGALMEFINLHTRDVTIKKIKLVLHTDTNLDLTSYCMRYSYLHLFSLVSMSHVGDMIRY